MWLGAEKIAHMENGPNKEVDVFWISPDTRCDTTGLNAPIDKDVFQFQSVVFYDVILTLTRPVWIESDSVHT